MQENGPPLISLLSPWQSVSSACDGMRSCMFEGSQPPATPLQPVGATPLQPVGKGKEQSFA